MSKPAFKRFVNNKYIPWDVNNFGFKANLSDINASVLSDQIQNYSKTAKIKKKIFSLYKKNFNNIDQVFFPRENKNKFRDYYLFPIGVNRKYRNSLIEHLLEKKIFVTVNFKSITELKYYKKKYNDKSCPKSLEWGEQQISLPFHVKIKNSEIKLICSEIKKFFKKTNL